MNLSYSICLYSLLFLPPLVISLYNTTSQNLTYPMCPCDNSTLNSTDRKAKHAKEMKDAILNKTTWLQKARHRATHSRDAYVASFILTALLISLLFGVAASKMWKDKNFQAIQQKQPVHYEDYNKKTEVTVKNMLKSKARGLVKFFSHHGKRPMRSSHSSKLNEGQSLQMQSFLDQDNRESGDFVDLNEIHEVDFASRKNIHRKLLRSSSSNSSTSDADELKPSLMQEESSSTESEEENVFQMNKKTGEWSGEKKSRLKGAPTRREATTSFLSRLKKPKKLFPRTEYHKKKDENSEEEVKLLADSESNASSGSDYTEENDTFLFG